MNDKLHVQLEVQDWNAAVEGQGGQGLVNLRHPDAGVFIVAFGIDAPDSVRSVEEKVAIHLIFQRYLGMFDG